MVPIVATLIIANGFNPTSVLLVLGVTYVAAGLLGGMPVCHGAGGLTAHYRFGARTGGATVMLGGILIVLALGFGSGAARFFALIPLPVLAALLCLVGIQHSLLARDVRGWPERAIVIAIAGIGIASSNLAWGFLAGIAADQLLRLARRAFPPLSREGSAGGGCRRPVRVVSGPDWTSSLSQLAASISEVGENRTLKTHPLPDYEPV